MCHESLDQTLYLGFVMRGAETDAQACGARRYSRRSDRTDIEALVAQAGRDLQRTLTLSYQHGLNGCISPGLRQARLGEAALEVKNVFKQFGPR